MSEFSNGKEELELIDPPLMGKYAWFKGNCQESVSRIDRLLLSSECNEEFRMIIQELIPRLKSDHVPLQLLC